MPCAPQHLTLAVPERDVPPAHDRLGGGEEPLQLVDRGWVGAAPRERRNVAGRDPPSEQVRAGAHHGARVQERADGRLDVVADEAAVLQLSGVYLATGRPDPNGA